MPKFEVIEEDEKPELRTTTFDTPIPAHTLDTLLLGLKALPKRTALAISNCFALLTVASVFWLAMLIVPYTPNTFQLAGLAGYGLFVIAVNIITRQIR